MSKLRLNISACGGLCTVDSNDFSMFMIVWIILNKEGIIKLVKISVTPLVTILNIAVYT